MLAMAILPPGGSTPPPALPPTGGQPAAAASSTATATARAAAQALPPTLAQALSAPGASVEASVAGRTAAGLTTLSTPQGQVVLQTALSWPTGSGVALTLQSAGPPPVLGLALQPAPGQASGAQGQGATSGQAGSALLQQGQSGAAPAGSTGPAVLTTASQGIATTATVLSSTATTAASAGPPAAQPPPGNPPQGGQPGQPAVSAQGQSQGAAADLRPGAQAAGSSAAQGTAGQPTLPQGSQIPVRVLALAQPGLPLAPLGAGALPVGQSLLTGQVLSGAPQGQTLIATPRGTLSLPMGSPPPGTQIALALTGQPAAPVGADSSGRMAAMGDALRALTDAATAGSSRAANALQTLQALTPQAGGQFAAAALFFLQATRGGQGARAWLGGATVDALEAAAGKRGGAGLDALGGTEGRARDAAGTDWRMTTLPFLSEGRLEEIHLYRRPPDDAEDAAGQDAADRPVRFVVEARFSVLGDIQLDTLTRPGHVDLMLRSLEPLPEDMREDIRALFANTVSALGRAGDIGFQTVKRFDLVPVEGDDFGNTGETSA